MQKLKIENLFIYLSFDETLHEADQAIISPLVGVLAEAHLWHAHDCQALMVRKSTYASHVILPKLSHHIIY